MDNQPQKQNPDSLKKSIDFTENVYEQLFMMCKRRKTTLHDVCRKKGINRGTLDKWKHKQPLPFTLLGKILNEINEIE